MKYMVVVCLCNNRTSQIHRDFYNLWHAVTHETVSEWEQQRNTMWNFWSMIWLEVKQVYNIIFFFFINTLRKALKASDGFSSKWNWMVTFFFVYVVESWPINAQALDRHFFFSIQRLDAGIINHLFILSIKLLQIGYSLWNHTTPLFGKPSNRCIFSLFPFKALHFTPMTGSNKSIWIFFGSVFGESSILWSHSSLCTPKFNIFWWIQKKNL